ncbi:tetratricopeptide repeat protein [Nocardia asiatica]|uniref:tetratricopeptide repeat protein n=1 Tax=Nocardia asiatica TaxID=209252 RepID=UPI0024566E23|nr:hypothetical protein [Nocardia asiatica]
MNERYSSWAARNSPEELPLAARYQSADPIVWHGSMVYPMYTEQVGPAPTTVTLTMISAAPPAGLRGLGMGLSVVDGYLDLHGRSLAGVDAWSDALAAGVSFDVTPTAPVTLVTLTPVWVDEFGTQKSWSGNYGIVVEHRPNGRVVLWCSIGEGPPNFANLVVEVSTAASPVTAAPAALAPPLGMASPTLSSGPPTAPTMPVPRIDAVPVPTGPAATVEPLAPEPPVAGNGHRSTNGLAPEGSEVRRAGSLFVNMQSSRPGRSTPRTHDSAPAVAPDAPPDTGRLTASPSSGSPVADVMDSASHAAPPEPEGVNSAFGALVPHARTEPPARTVHDSSGGSGRPTADPYGAFGPPVAHTHPPEDPARHTAGLPIGNPRSGPGGPSSPTTRPAPDGPHNGSGPVATNSWTTGDSFRAFDHAEPHTPAATHTLPPSPQPAEAPSAPVFPNSAASRPTADGPHNGSGPVTTNSWTTGDSFRAFDHAEPHTPVPAPTLPNNPGPAEATPPAAVADSAPARPTAAWYRAFDGTAQVAPPASALPVESPSTPHSSEAARPTTDGPHTGSNSPAANPAPPADSYRASDPTGSHPPGPTRTAPLDPGPAQAHPALIIPGAPAPAPGGPHTSANPQATSPALPADFFRPFDPADTHPPDTTEAASGSPREPHRTQGGTTSSGGPHAPAAHVFTDAPASLRANTHPASSPRVPDTAPAPGGLGQPGARPVAADASPRASTPGQSGDPGYRGALYDLGVAMYRRGEEEQACGLWAQASEAGHAGAAYELGMVRLRRGDPLGAESWWRTAADRREPRAIAELADLLDQLGKHAEAKSWRTYAAEQQDSDVVGQSTSR